jgi:hypothetical protein
VLLEPLVVEPQLLELWAEPSQVRGSIQVHPQAGTARAGTNVPDVCGHARIGEVCRDPVGDPIGRSDAQLDHDAVGTTLDECPDRRSATEV